MQQKVINEEVVEKLISRVEWFFDKFLNDEEYQKSELERTSDLIYKAIAKQIYSFYGPRLNLVEIYKRKPKNS